MATDSDIAPVDFPWDPSPEAVTSRRWEREDSPTVVLMTHLSAPYYRTATSTDFAALREIAHGYVQAATQLDIAPKFELDTYWLQVLDPHAPSAVALFGWMAPQVPGDDVHLPLRSFDASTSASDGLFVMFAAEQLGQDRFIGSEFGLRIALRWRPWPNDTFLVSIVGMTATLPFGAYKTNPLRLAAGSIDLANDLLFDVGVLSRMAQMGGLTEETVQLRGARIARLESGQLQAELQGVGLRTVSDQTKTPHAITILAVGQSATLLHQSPMVADATGCAQFFKHVPPPGADKGVRRNKSTLNACRTMDILATNQPAPTLEEGAYLRILPCPRFVRADRVQAGPVQKVPAPGDGQTPLVRSDVGSAIQAFWHGREFIRRLQAYKLDPAVCFRFIQPRIDIQYRSGVSPGPGKDGQSVNARVQPFGWPAGWISAPVARNNLPVAHLHLSLADKARRERKRWQPGDNKRAPVEPMGIGADERWMWHEFGHVLTLAFTGELELRFAHSPGDALAAIVGDPYLDPAKAKTPWRGCTFPWVFLPRRHDRCVLKGWSWGGTMHQDLARVPASQHPRMKGYQSEQILSSTMFRLYRCLGGDTVADASGALTERIRASHYACFLIMQALRTLGDAKVTPAMVPEQFELALKEADLHPDMWTAVPPEKPSILCERVGGCSTKVIRWAFEAQGLHGPAGPDVHNAPGLPRKVDIFVKSLRPLVDDALSSTLVFGAGSYVPVSMHWQYDSFDTPPKWQADAAGGIVWDAATDEINVIVGNRGSMKARNVEVRVWTTPWPSAAPPPTWMTGDPAWQTCTPTAPTPQDIPPDSTRSFGPFAFTAGTGRHVLVAVATCAADRALIASANHACSFLRTPLPDLVGGDNNMGLRVIEKP